MLNGNDGTSNGPLICLQLEAEQASVISTIRELMSGCDHVVYSAAWK
jgi:hypothetical protein